MGEKVDLESIYKLYMNDLFHYVYSLAKNKQVAEDVVQETFYRAHVFLESYKGEKIRPWLFKVAYNTFIDMLRKDKRLSFYDSTLLDSQTKQESKSAEDEFFLKNQVNDWFELIKQLSVEKRNAIILRDYYQFSYEEIAQLTGLSLSKTKVTIHRGRKELQLLIAKYELKE